jgi:hypothetical protein
LKRDSLESKGQDVVLVQLMGGLGNQLFQVAAGIEKCNKTEAVYLDSRFGNPRVNALGKPEIFSFDLPFAKEFPSSESSQFNLWIGKKCHGLAIRSIGGKGQLFRNFTQSALTVINFGRFGKYIPTFIPSDLGWDKRFENFSRGYIFGYCQSYRYSLNAIKRMEKIRLKNPSSLFLELREEIIRLNPIVIHLRRGDYRQEKNFGVLALDYYVEAKRQYESFYENRPIWLFTDSAEEKEISEFCETLRVSKFLGSNSISTPETFELMRHGQGFIIGNSSFSWWAAMLAYEPNAPVFAPNPWFKAGKSPEQILPLHWHKVESSFE